MAHGPDTEELLRRIADIQENKLIISGLRITSLPDLPADIQILWCYDTQLTSLPALPSGLQTLYCYNTLLISLPDLPSGLESIDCPNTPLTSLPDLPSGLQSLFCYNTQLTSLPDLPSGLTDLDCSNTPLLLQRGASETIAEYNARWRAWREEQASKKRCQERSKTVKEDLMIYVWRPDRLEKLLEVGGWKLVDMLIGAEVAD